MLHLLVSAPVLCQPTRFCSQNTEVPFDTMFGVKTLRTVGPAVCRRGASVLWKPTRTQSRTQSAAAGQRVGIGGIYPPIATPFTQKEDVDYQKLDENLQKYAKIPFKGNYNLQSIFCNDRLVYPGSSFYTVFFANRNELWKWRQHDLRIVHLIILYAY